MDDSLKVDDYGWEDAGKTCAHAYLEPAILDLCARLSVGRILDLGCGNGALCRTLAEAGYEVSGCDADPRGIALASQAHPGIPFRVAVIGDGPAPTGEAAYDAVVSTEVIEHLYRPRDLPRFARGVLGPGGYLIVSTPYHGYLKNLALSLFGKWDRHHDPLWDGGHIKFWSPATLARLLEEEGFAVRAFRGVGRLPWLWKSMILVARKRPDPEARREGQGLGGTGARA